MKNKSSLAVWNVKEDQFPQKRENGEQIKVSLKICDSGPIRT